MRARVLLAVALSLTALLGGACGRDQPASALAGAQVVAPADREAAPTVAGTALDGSSLDVADLRGKVVVLNAWASWCTPCRTEIPAFVALADTADPADVAVVGLNVKDDHAAATAFVEDFAMRYPSIVDVDGAMLAAIPGVPPSALPSTVILDRDGRIAARIIGEARADDLAQTVTDLIAEQAA